MRKITNEELLDETIEYYRTNPRGMTSFYTGNYKTLKGHMCAVGRCLKKSSFENNNIKNNVTVSSLKNLSKLVKAKYTNIAIWDILQDLHDKCRYWIRNDLGGTNLSLEGEVFVEALRETCQSS